METRRHSHRLARQQVVCLAPGVPPRRSDEGYEMANSSTAVVPSSPCNVRGLVTRRMRHSLANSTVLLTQETTTRFEDGRRTRLPSLADKVDDGGWMRG